MKKAPTKTVRKSVSIPGDEHIKRVRRMCSALPQTVEKLSHGEPTFFVKERVFALEAHIRQAWQLIVNKK